MRRQFGSPAAGLCARDGILGANFRRDARREQRKPLIARFRPDTLSLKARRATRRFEQSQEKSKVKIQGE
jgi:hypothetical protein